MKEKKNGWGTLEMLLLCGGLVLALLVAIYFISKLYGSFDISTSNRQYMNLEVKLENAARDYIKNNDINVVDNYRISLSALRESDSSLKDFKDNNGDACDGYVIVNNIDNINYYNAYITCNDYQTTKK